MSETKVKIEETLASESASTNTQQEQKTSTEKTQQLKWRKEIIRLIKQKNSCELEAIYKNRENKSWNLNFSFQTTTGTVIPVLMAIDYATECPEILKTVLHLGAPLRQVYYKSNVTPREYAMEKKLSSEFMSLLLETEVKELEIFDPYYKLDEKTKNYFLCAYAGESATLCKLASEYRFATNESFWDILTPSGATLIEFAVLGRNAATLDAILRGSSSNKLKQIKSDRNKRMKTIMDILFEDLIPFVYHTNIIKLLWKRVNSLGAYRNLWENALFDCLDKNLTDTVLVTIELDPTLARLCSSKDETVLMAASNHPNVWKALLLAENQRKFLFEATNSFGENILMHLGKSDKVESFKQVVRIQPELLNSNDKAGSTLIMNVAYHGGFNVLKFLVSIHKRAVGILLDKNKNGFNALSFAVSTGRLDIVQYILGIPIKDKILMAIDNTGSNVLHLCIAYNIEMARYIVTEHDPDAILQKHKNQEGLTPFELAIKVGKVLQCTFLSLEAQEARVLQRKVAEQAKRIIELEESLRQARSTERKETIEGSFAASLNTKSNPMLLQSFSSQDAGAGSGSGIAVFSKTATNTSSKLGVVTGIKRPLPEDASDEQSAAKKQCLRGGAKENEDSI